MNTDTGKSFLIEDLAVAGRSITFSTKQLEMNHFYDVIVMAFNIAGTLRSSGRQSKCMEMAILANK